MAQHEGREGVLNRMGGGSGLDETGDGAGQEQEVLARTGTRQHSRVGDET